MALYTEQSEDWLKNILATGDDNRRRVQAALYEARKESVDNKYKADNGGLSGLLSNLFKDVKAAGNVAATTASAVASPFVQNMNEYRRESTLNNSKQAQNEIAKKYGYADVDEAYDKGDGPDEMWEELKGATKKADDSIKQISSDFKNNAAVKKINDTKQSQFAADALRTETNLLRALVPAAAASPVGGAVTGAIEGAADTIENSDGTLLDLEARLSNGKIRNTENTKIDGGDLAKNALIGAGVGAATAGVGNKIGNAKSAIGSKLLNNRVITSGVGRGAVGGAVGGALGSGANAALEGGDVAGAMLQGAGSGALTGGVAGGLTSGARNLTNKATSALGISDNLNNLRQKLTYTPEQKPTASTIETAQDNNDTTNSEKDFASRTAKDNVAETLKRTGRYLEGMQAALNKSDKKAIGVKDTGKFIDGVRRKTGLDRVPDQAEFSKYITGGPDSILDTSQRNALSYDANGKPFYADTSDIFNGIDEVLKTAKVTGAALGGRAQKQKFVQSLQDDLLDSNGDLLSLASSWHDTAATLRKSDAKGAKIQAKVFETMARKVEDASYAKIPQENVDAMFEVSSMKLRELGESAVNPKVRQAALKAAESLDNTPRTIEDFRHFKEDFVKVNKINDKVLENENGGAVRQARTFRGTLNAVKDAFIEKPAYWAANKVGVGLTNAGDAVANGPSIQATPTKPISTDMQMLYNIIGTRTGVNEGKDTRENTRKDREFKNLEDQLSYAMTDAAIDAVPGLTSYNTLINQYNAANNNTNQGSQQLSYIANAMDNALAAGDLNSYSKLASLYQTAYKIYSLQNPQETSGSKEKLTEKQQKANAASDILDQLETMNPDFGYSVRDIPGLNIINAGGNQYASTADSLATQLGYMMSGATVTPAEYERIKQQYVPQPWDSEEQRKYKLQQARKVIQQYQKGYAE